MKLTNEMKIGILVMGVAVALLALTFRVGNFNFAKKGYTIKVQFHRIEGLEKNAPVRLNGFDVGSVKSIRILYSQETTMELTLWLEDKAKLREGTKAFVKNMGLLGEKYVDLTSDSKDAAFLPSGVVIVGEEPADFERLLAKGDVIADNLKAISENISERLKINGKALDEIVLHVNTATKNIASISENVNERLTINRQSIDEIIASLHAATGNFEELSDDLKRNPWKIMYRSKEKEKNKNP